jgi:hypothetical protein
MAKKKFYVDIDLGGQQIINVGLERLAAHPTAGNAFESRIYYNTADKCLYYYNGTAWTKATGDITDVQSGNTMITASTDAAGVVTITLVPANIAHSALSGVGSNTHAQIDTHIASTANPHQTTLEQARSQNNTVAGDIAMATHKITGLGTPAADTDAATKGYVDAVAQGLDPHDEVRVATTGELAVVAAGTGATKTLTAAANGAITIDNIALALNDRVLVKDQTNTVDNGVYKVTTVGSAGAKYVLTRTGDFDGTPATEVAAGDYFFVKTGTANASTGWVLRAYNNADPIVDTDPMVFSQFSGAGTYTAGAGLNLAGTVFSVKPDITTGATVAGAKVSSNGVGVGIDNATIVKDGSENISVQGYTRVSGATVVRKKEFTTQSFVANTGKMITHSLGVKAVKVTVYDEADFAEVELSVVPTDTNVVVLTSNIAFTGTVVVEG